MTLLELQRQVAGAIMSLAGTTESDVRLNVSRLIRPSARLSSVERLDIYRDSYWSRVIGSLEDDFPGVRGILGPLTFARVSRQYLAECPSQSFTLRNLGSRFEEWLKQQPRLGGSRHSLVLDMARLEWAHIEAFDAATLTPLGPEHLLAPDPEMRIDLQPHVLLLKIRYPVDDLRLRLVEIALEDPQIRGTSQRQRQRLATRKCLAGKQIKEICLAVHRREFTVYYRRLEADEFPILRALHGGAVLWKALELAQSSHHLIGSWFEAWSEMGWLVPASNVALTRGNNV